MMKPRDARILWRARAYAGESECPAESLALLSMTEGQASVLGPAASESSEAHRCLSAMLASLAFAALLPASRAKCTASEFYDHFYRLHYQQLGWPW